MKLKLLRMLHKPQNLALLLGFSTALIVLALLVLFPLSGPGTTPGLALLLGALYSPAYWYSSWPAAPSPALCTKR